MGVNFFKFIIFSAALSDLLVQLKDSFNKVETILNLFEVIFDPQAKLSQCQTKQFASRLVSEYPDDLRVDDLEAELRYFTKYNESIGVPKNKGLGTQFYLEKKLQKIYPKISIFLRIFLLIPASFACGGRLYSKLVLSKIS